MSLINFVKIYDIYNGEESFWKGLILYLEERFGDEDLSEFLEYYRTIIYHVG